MTLTQLPILDLSLADDPATAEDFRAELRRVTHEIGFFYLTGHGVPEADFSRIIDTAQRFFALPEADKLAIENTNSPHFRGYTRTGGERTQGRVDWREQIDIGPERAPVAEPVHDFDHLTGPNQYPAALPELREATESWHARLSEVGDRLLSEWALSLGQSADHFASAFAEDPASFIKIVRYPEAESESVSQGVGEHRDGGTLTLLYPQPGTTGLQVLTDDGWIDADPIENAFVVNIGKLLEVATNGYLKATVHRVLPTGPGEDRISIPFFYNPALDASLPEVELPAELAAEARGVTQDERDALHAVYGENAFMSRLRSHPNVAEKFYPRHVSREPRRRLVGPGSSRR
ncbi:isopenicillin N synthase family dioxygenase [Brevibacterium atlanticum]|uniref:isopenicillin N synthase family dioxygenase n=1 Tax=Brevibacterium atlanticum TaxID=2697563 RepID=UPI00141F1453|nr:isopenicillin N synthase family oxygenase [Brevibacterium atlanticum]